MKPERSYAWLQGLLCGVAAALFPGAALLAAFLLAPGLVALVVDHASGKPTARAILLLGAAAAIPPLVSLCHSGGTLSSAAALLGHPAATGTAWLLGACGWLLDQCAPLLLRFVLNATAAARAARLSAERARLLEAWDFTSVPEETLSDQAAIGSIS